MPTWSIERSRNGVELKLSVDSDAAVSWKAQLQAQGAERKVLRAIYFDTDDSRLAGERTAVVMSLLQAAKLNEHEPWAYLKDVLTRLPTPLNSRIEELLPHKWRPAG